MTGTMARYYASPSATSGLSRHAGALRMFRGTADDAGRWARNAVLHYKQAARMNVKVTDELFGDFITRSAAQTIDRVLARNHAPLSVPREPHERMLGNCYHQTLLACAFLRHVRVPARLRFGFAPYLMPPKYEDHCLCEVLLGGRWCAFDPSHSLDIGDEDVATFIPAGDAWLRCRTGQADPGEFGSYGMFGGGEERGWNYLRNNLLRDYAALCKVELHPWDWWGLMLRGDQGAPPEMLDELARLALDDDRWAERNTRFETDPLIGPHGTVLMSGELAGHTECRDAPLPATW